MRYRSLREGAQRDASTRDRFRRRRGAAVVEFALIAPFLALLFVITVDFSRIFYYALTLKQCARNGALYGSALNSYLETSAVSPYSISVPPTDSNIKAFTITDGATLSPALTTSMVTVTHNKGSDGNTAVQVAITYNFVSITQFPIFGSNFTLKATSSMRMGQ